MDPDEPLPPGEEGDEPPPPGLENAALANGSADTVAPAFEAGYPHMAPVDSFSQSYAAPQVDAYQYGYYPGVDANAQVASTAWQDYYNYYGSYGATAPGYEYGYDNYYNGEASALPAVDTVTAADLPAEPVSVAPQPELFTDAKKSELLDSLTALQREEAEKARQEAEEAQRALDAVNTTATVASEGITLPATFGQSADDTAKSTVVGPSSDMLSLLRQRLAEFPQLSSRKTASVESDQTKKKALPPVMLKGAKLVVNQPAKASDRNDQLVADVTVAEPVANDPMSRDTEDDEARAPTATKSVPGPTFKLQLASKTAAEQLEGSSRPNHDVLRRPASPLVVENAAEDAGLPIAAGPPESPKSTSPREYGPVSPGNKRPAELPVRRSPTSRWENTGRTFSRHQRSLSPARHRRSETPPWNSRTTRSKRGGLSAKDEFTSGNRNRYREAEYVRGRRPRQQTSSPNDSSEGQSESPRGGRRERKDPRRGTDVEGTLRGEATRRRGGGGRGGVGRGWEYGPGGRFGGQEGRGARGRAGGRGAYGKIADENERWQMESGSPVEDGELDDIAATKKLKATSEIPSLAYTEPPKGKPLFPIGTAAAAVLNPVLPSTQSGLFLVQSNSAEGGPAKAEVPPSSYAKVLAEDRGAVSLRDKYLGAFAGAPTAPLCTAKDTLTTLSRPVYATLQADSIMAVANQEAPAAPVQRGNNGYWTKQQSGKEDSPVLGSREGRGWDASRSVSERGRDDDEFDGTVKAKKQKKDKKRKREKEKKKKSKKSTRDGRGDDSDGGDPGRPRWTSLPSRSASPRDLDAFDDYQQGDWDDCVPANHEGRRSKKHRHIGHHPEFHTSVKDTDHRAAAAANMSHPPISHRSPAHGRSRDRSHDRSLDQSREQSHEHEEGVEAAKAAQAVRMATLQMSGINLQMSRHARRIYVGNLPPSISEVELTQFFNNLMVATNATVGPGLPIISCYMNPEKRFAFLEFRSVEETSNAMAFDGVGCRTETLKVRRPHDFNPQTAALMGPIDPSPLLNLAMLGVVSSMVPDGPNRLFVGGLPGCLNEAQVRELVQAFGALKAFNVTVDVDSGGSNGYAFCEYMDPGVTNAAMHGLSTIKVGGKTLVVRKATNAHEAEAAVQSMLRREAGPPAVSRVLRLSNMLERDELLDEDEYNDIVDDISTEITKYGKLTSVVVPKPHAKQESDPPGVGKVFVMFESTDGSKKAQAALNGRKFGEHVVEALFYSESKFEQQDFS